MYMKTSKIFLTFVVVLFTSLGAFIGYFSNTQTAQVIVTLPEIQERTELEEIEELLTTRIQAQDKKIRRSWNKEEIHEASKIIQKISENYSIPFPTIIAMIEHESSLYKKARSKPNRNGTRDYGLTQQNSRYAKVRYTRIFKEQFSQEKLFNYKVSLKMMAERLKECSNYSTTDERVLCYNSEANIKYNRKKYLNHVNEKLKEFNKNIKKYSQSI